MTHKEIIRELSGMLIVNEKERQAVSEAVAILKATDWIPCEERLPESPGKYLVTVHNGNVYAGTYDVISGKFQCAAIAWMPLPEQYQNEG